MIDKEKFEKKAEEISKGNFYVKEGFEIGADWAEQEMQKEICEYKNTNIPCEEMIKKLQEENEQLKEQINTVKKCLLANQDMFKDTIYLYRDRQNSFEYYDETLFEYLGLDLIVNGEKELVE